MSPEEQERLAHIRANVEKWCALNPDAKNWDSAFLLRLLDGTNP